MKHFVVWIIIIQFATGHNLLAELCQMPNLLQHYKAHQQYAPDLSLTQFLWQHYGNNHDESDHRHNNLPLQCTHVLLADSTAPQQILLWDGIAFPQIAVTNVEICITDEFLRLSAPLSGIFRPPLS